jgi:hypothetical protein
MKKNLKWATQEAPPSILPTLTFLENGMAFMCTLFDPHNMHTTPIVLVDSTRNGKVVV